MADQTGTSARVNRLPIMENSFIYTWYSTTYEGLKKWEMKNSFVAEMIM